MRPTRNTQRSWDIPEHCAAAADALSRSDELRPPVENCEEENAIRSAFGSGREVERAVARRMILAWSLTMS